MFNRRIGSVKAVDDVSFSVLKGETLGVVGESGCGKSTLARVLMGLIPQDEGRVIFDGDLVGGRQGMSLRDLRRNMQIVFQDSDSSLNPRLPVADSIVDGPATTGRAAPKPRRSPMICCKGSASIPASLPCATPMRCRAAKNSV